MSASYSTGRSLPIFLVSAQRRYHVVSNWLDGSRPWALETVAQPAPEGSRICSYLCVNPFYDKEMVALYFRRFFA